MIEAEVTITPELVSPDMRLRRILAPITRTTPRQREILALRVINGMTPTKIASQLKVEAPTVYTMLGLCARSVGQNRQTFEHELTCAYFTQLGKEIALAECEG